MMMLMMVMVMMMTTASATVVMVMTTASATVVMVMATATATPPMVAASIDGTSDEQADDNGDEHDNEDGRDRLTHVNLLAIVVLDQKHVSLGGMLSCLEVDILQRERGEEGGVGVTFGVWGTFMGKLSLTNASPSFERGLLARIVRLPLRLTSILCSVHSRSHSSSAASDVTLSAR